jgi:hypothetical protein
LHYLNTERRDIIYGLNTLGDYELSFALADQYNAKFIQIDYFPAGN